MTTVTTFQCSYFIRAAAAAIYAHLAEPTNYIGLSPLLISLTDVQWGTNLQGQQFVGYKSVELFRFFGLFSYQNPLDVVMTLTIPEQQIVSDVQSTMNIRVNFTFDLQPERGGTTIHETITVRSPALLKRFVVGQAKTVQQNRIRVLTSRMETNPQ